MLRVYDTFLELDAVHTDTLLLKKVGQLNAPHIKVDANLAVVGNRNVAYALVVDGADVVDELGLKAPNSNPTLTGTVAAPALNVTSATVANNLRINGLLTASAKVKKTNGAPGQTSKGQSTDFEIVKFLDSGTA